MSNPKNGLVFPRTDVTERHVARIETLRLKSGVKAGFELPGEIKGLRVEMPYGPPTDRAVVIK